MKKIIFTYWVQILFLFLLSITLDAFAENPAYDRIMSEASEAYQNENYKLSIRLLLEANQEKPSAHLLYNVAKTYGKANDCGLAIVYYKAFLRTEDHFQEGHRTRVKRAKRAIKRAKKCGNYSPDLSGRLMIQTTPPGIRVVIDNEAIGVTPLEVAGFIAGPHALYFHHPQYEDITEEIILEIDKDYTEFVKLKKKTIPPNVASIIKTPKSEATETSSRFFSLGIVFGGNYNQLNRPKDIQGAPTLLYGSAFTGRGFFGGISSTLDALHFGAHALTLRLDILFAHNEITGFASNLTQNYKQQLTFIDQSIRAPLLTGYTLSLGQSRLYLLGGADILLHSIETKSIVTQDRGVTPQPINTRAPNRIQFLGVFGYAYQTPGWSIPLDFRFMYNPYTQKTTRTRFSNYQSETSPGAYQVAFDWQVMVTLGISKVF